MDNYKYCLLRMVNAEANNNKDYEMVQTSEQTFEVHYGRVKSSKMVKVYDMSVWDSIYEQKIQKGYIDVTDTINAVVQEQSMYKEIENDEIRHLIDELLRYANEYVEKTYKISKHEVTQQMFSIADGYIQVYVKITSLFIRLMQCYKSFSPLFREKWRTFLLILLLDRMRWPASFSENKRISQY